MSAPEFFAAYPVLPCADISRAASYYQDILGFNVKTMSPDKNYAIVERGKWNCISTHPSSPASTPWATPNATYGSQVKSTHSMPNSPAEAHFEAYRYWMSFECALGWRIRHGVRRFHL